VNRRDVLLSTAALRAEPATPLRAEDTDAGVSAEAARLYDKAIVFDANCGPRCRKKFPFPKEMLDVSAQSASPRQDLVGRTDSNFEDTLTEIAFFQRVIEHIRRISLQVREASDFARAKSEKSSASCSLSNPPNVRRQVERIGAVPQSSVCV